MAAADLSLARWTRRVLRLERDFKAFQMTPRLGNSSIDDGGAIIIRDPNTGDDVVIIGGQPDGQIGIGHVDTTPPPTPSAPTIEPALGFVYMIWDGTFEGGIGAPLNFGSIQIHGSTDPAFVPIDDTTLRGTISTPTGGRTSAGVPYDQDTYFRAVAVSLSGTKSPASPVASGRARKIENPDITPAAIEADNIADFVLAITKFKTKNHEIY